MSAIALLQGEGSEGTVNRESVVTNVEVPDADVVQAANSGFFPGEEVLPNDEPDRVQSGKRFPGEDDEQEDPVMQGFATTSLVDSTTAGHKGREQ